MSSSVADILFGPWAILEQRLHTIHEVYRVHLTGGKTDWLKAYEDGRIDKPRTPYAVQDRVAVVPIEGILARKINMLDAMSGGASYQTMAATFAQAMVDPDVDGIVLSVGSPGGSVHGLESFAGLIREARDVKPVVAWSDSMMLSAAYWLGSSASSVYAGGQMADFGSVGVVAIHEDHSAADEKVGVKRTEIFAGRYKRIASDTGPLSKEGREYIQTRVDQSYDVFVDTVAKNRGVSPKDALAMADGKVFAGADALDVGLIDGFKSLEGAMDEVRSRAGIKRASAQREQLRAMDKTQLQTENPALAKELHDEGYSKGLVAGQDAERERIAQIRANALPGHEDLVDACVADGSTVAQAQSRMIKAAQEAHKSAAAARFEATEKPLPNAGPTSAKVEAKAPATVQETVAEAFNLTEKAREYQAAQEAKGLKVQMTDAVMHVLSKQGA